MCIPDLGQYIITYQNTGSDDNTMILFLCLERLSEPGE